MTNNQAFWIFAYHAWIDGADLLSAAREQTLRYAADQPFVDRLWDNDISGAMTWYAEKRTDDDSYTVARETLACQVMRAVRDGAPETALETLDALLEQYPDDPLGLRLRGDLQAPLPDAPPGAG